jgi:antitoxin component YwqK of YwqJK toxin-antitoxin module
VLRGTLIQMLPAMTPRTMSKYLKIFLIVVFFILAYNIISNFSYYKSQFNSINSNAQWDKSDLKGQTIGGLKQGEWKSYFPNGQLAEVKTFKNDTLNGLHVGYTPDGQFQIKEIFYMGTKIDTFKLYLNGDLNILEFRDSTGMRQGTTKVYVDNSLSQVGHYRDNKMHGEWKLYHLKNQKLKIIYEYTNGVKSGKWIYFNNNGDTTKIEEY